MNQELFKQVQFFYAGDYIVNVETISGCTGTTISYSKPTSMYTN